MALAYTPPRITITETVSPSFNPALIDPNSICIVGPAQGFQEHAEVFVLDDNHPVALTGTYPDVSTIRVVDATNVTLAPFAASTVSAELDYDVDVTNIGTTGIVTVARAMQTAIDDAEEVVVYYENSASPAQADGKTDFITLNKTSESPLSFATLNTQAASVRVQSAGHAPLADFSLTDIADAPAIVWVNTATVLRKYQTVYLDYVIDGGATITDAPVQLNNLTPVPLGVDADTIVVKTAPGAPTSTAVTYSKGTTTDLDYRLLGSGATSGIARSAGTTTIGLAQDKLTVRVTYQATPPTYWLARRCFSQNDVESVFGPAFDSAGNIVNPVSFGASLAFAGGVNSVIVQPLFADGTPRVQPTGILTDWQSTLANLRDVEDITVIVPLVTAGGLTASDSLNLTILEAVQDHVNYMQQNQNQLIMAICGEDSSSGSLASQAVLRDHAQALAARSPAQSMALCSPASYTFTNPVTGLPSNVGGQYAAAVVAGMFGQYTVQMPLTRKRVNVLSGINDIRTEADKNADAAAGLLVIESKRGIIQVRHAITVANDVISNQELNVVRAKYWMMTSLAAALDTQVLGNYVIDNNTAFQIQLAVDAVLQQLLQQGAIVAYQNIQVRRNPTVATGMQVQFSYLPAYALNYIDISFSLDSATGVTLTSAGTATPTSGQGI